MFKSLIIFVFIVFSSLKAHADEARLAVASNFVNTAQVLVLKFSENTPHKVSVSAASTGKLYAQIRQAAPFDVFLSADRQTPERLVSEALAVKESLFDYARGRLVFVSQAPGGGLPAEQLLRDGQFKKLAIANPELAPYGLAAKQTLEALGLLPKVQARLVMGENIGQAAQFVFSGNADAGLLPRAYVLETPEQKKLYQNSWLVPESLHQPIIQTAVLLTRGQHNRAALAFMQYLQQPAAQGIIASHGYN
ncbi:MAG: molybdate ABC transporter substrate-binding protein [Alcaligenaceae bacterium]